MPALDNDRPVDLVEGSDKVERIFGRWPDFHDAEVLSIVLDRVPADDGPTVRIAVHAFEATKEVHASGHYVLRNHVVVTFVLHAAEVVRLEGFNHQNVLFDLRFSRPDKPVAEGMTVEVGLESSYGVAATFQCARVEVVSVDPFDPAKEGAMSLTTRGGTRANTRMFQNLVELASAKGSSLRPRLRAVLSPGFVSEAGCTLLRALREGASTAKPEDFPDLTGFECFVNHLHIEDQVSLAGAHDELEQAVLFAGSLWTALRLLGDFRIIVAQDQDGGCNVRFHTTRPGESLLVDNLEAYLLDAVFVIDVNRDSVDNAR